MFLSIEFTTLQAHLVHKWLELEQPFSEMVLQEDPFEWTANNLENEQITQLENLMIAATPLLDHLFLIRTVEKYLHKQTNIILNHKLFYQHNNNKTNSMETHHKEEANMAELHNMVVLQHKLPFKQVNLRAEELELNSGDLSFKIKNNEIKVKSFILLVKVSFISNK